MIHKSTQLSSTHTYNEKKEIIIIEKEANEDTSKIDLSKEPTFKGSIKYKGKTNLVQYQLWNYNQLIKKE